MSTNKTSLQKAILEAKEIEKAAFDNAKKVLEESMNPKIEQAVKESLRELENEKVNEGLKIDVAQGADLKINVTADGTATVEVGNDSSVETPALEIPVPIELGAEEEKNTNLDTDTDMENKNQEDEIYEVEGLSEIGAEPTDVNAPVASAPAAPAAMDAPPVDAATAETGEAAPTDLAGQLADISQKLDMILAHEEGEEQGETSETSPEGEVEIVDDETPATAEVPTPAPVAQEGGIGMAEEEVVYEVEDDLHSMFEEMGDLDEIEIVDESGMAFEEYEEEGLEEDSLSVRHIAGQRGKIAKKVPLGKHAPHSDVAKGLNESEVKAQYESQVDELKKENASLMETIKEYKESFIVLRKQINEVQIFNAKLAYANKLFTSGGLTNDEKIKIAEEFDKAETIEEAKKLYNKLISEVSSKGSKTVADKIKSVKPAIVASNSNSSQTLFESEEFKRMRKLAGIIKENKE